MHTKPILLYLLIIAGLFVICVTNGFFLNSTDGITHYNYYINSKCTSDIYANGVCIVSATFGTLTQTQFWLLWFTILAAIPLLLYYFFRNAIILPGFFIFAGFWFSFQSMQTYAQILAIVFFIAIVFSKPSLNKIACIVGLLVFDLTNIFVIHNEFKYLLIIMFFVELAYIIKDRSYFIAIPFIPDVADQIRYNVYNKLPTLDNIFYFMLYYGYTFLYEYMFFFFTVAGIKELIKQKEWRHLTYFVVILIGAIYFWVYESFNVWRVSRVLLFFPVVVLPYFVIWLEKQSMKKQILFWAIGITYFAANVVFFILKQ